MAKITQVEKAKYFQIATGICGVTLNDAGSELLVNLYEAIIKKKGALNIHDIVKIQCEVEAKYNIPEDGKEEK